MSNVFGLIAPGPFYALAVLACPVGMGVMMWFMMRGGHHGDQKGSSSSPIDSTINHEVELAQLRDEINEIRSSLVERGGDRGVEQR